MKHSDCLYLTRLQANLLGFDNSKCSEHFSQKLTMKYKIPIMPFMYTGANAHVYLCMKCVYVKQLRKI